MKLYLKKSVYAIELNNFLRQIAFHSKYKDQRDFTNSNEIVSSDFVGNRYAGIIDSAATICNENHAILYVWYDNEYGYTHQVIRLAKYISNVRRYTYY